MLPAGRARALARPESRGRTRRAAGPCCRPAWTAARRARHTARPRPSWRGAWRWSGGTRMWSLPAPHCWGASERRKTHTLAQTLTVTLVRAGPALRWRAACAPRCSSTGRCGCAPRPGTRTRLRARCATCCRCWCACAPVMGSHVRDHACMHAALGSAILSVAQERDAQSLQLGLMSYGALPS